MSTRPEKPRPRATRSATQAGLPSATSEDYLERIHELIERKGYARAVDIAAQLKVSLPSVTAMVQKLAESGYLKYEKYRGLVMTEKGRAVAVSIKDRHATLKRFLRLLDLDEATAEHDIEGLEHSLSAATLERLTALADFFESSPEVLRAFLKKAQKRSG